MELASVFASAGVAAAVALGVDFFVKPGLEARRERIAEEDRNRRSFIRSINSLQSRLLMTSARVDSATMEEKTRLLADLIPEVSKLCDEMPIHVRWLPQEIATITMCDLAYLNGHLTGYARRMQEVLEDGLLHPELLRSKAAPFIRGRAVHLLAPTVDYAQTPKWRFLKRRRIRANVWRLAGSSTGFEAAKAVIAARTAYFSHDQTLDDARDDLPAPVERPQHSPPSGPGEAEPADA
ncbi:hypothetical protein [Micromonospora sediminicola]|uniref:hypothetical protein n=1 Tax=Micromonospora sediminicola TaxID=946078 RepID=UPI0034072D48